MTNFKGPYFIGRVKRAPHNGDSYFYASVEPLIESDPTGGRWVGPVRDGVSRFPKRGFVHWHDAPVAAKLGSLWQFTVDEHPWSERGERPEQFQLENYEEPIEVVDLRGWIDELDLRSVITGDGIHLSPAPLARRVVLWLASGLCAGPLLLKAGAAPGLWIVDSPEIHRDAARMPLCRPSEADIQRVSLEGERWFLAPSLSLGQSAGIQNWTSDSQVTRSILGKLRKFDKGMSKAISVTDSLFREYLEHVESGRMGSADPAVERARADRLRGVRDAIQRDASLLIEAAEALLVTATVREEVDRKVELSIAEELQRRRSEVELALADAVARLERLEGDFETKRAELKDLCSALSDKRRELEERVGSFDREVTTRLEEIARRPEAAFAEAAVMRAVLSVGMAAPLGHTNGRVRPLPAERHVSAPLAVDGQEVVRLEEEAAVRRALALHAGAGALSLYAMLALHAAFVAGTVPVVVGESSYDLLRAYASAVAGCRLHWIPIGSSAMEPQDLLGRFESVSGRIVPAAAGLLDVICDAKQSGRLHVVVLDGFNRGPSEAYLSPILEAALAGRMGDTARAIPLASARSVAEDDPYRELARLAWPTNVMIACLPSDGSATLPVPHSVWRFLAILDADDRDRPDMRVPTGGNRTPSCSEISPDLWTWSISAARNLGTEDKDEVVTLARALSLNRRDASDAIRMREGMRLNGLLAADARDLALAGTLVARSTVEVKGIEEGLRSAGIEGPGWRTIWNEAQRLRS